MSALEDHEPWYLPYVPESGDIAIDVGAHRGLWSLFLAERFQRVYAYDPLPQGSLAIAQHPDNVTVRAKAVGAKCGLIDLAMDANRGHFVIDLRIADGHVDYTLPYLCVALDHEFRNETGSIDFVKIDVEGGEVNVLRGASKLIEKHNPTVFVECHSEALRDECLALLPGAVQVHSWQYAVLSTIYFLVCQPRRTG